MIHSTSQSLGSHRPDAVLSPGGTASGPKKADSPKTENLSTASAETLRNALAAEPEIRPEVVEVGRNLAIDPNYPPREIIEQLAKMFTSAADPSEIP